MPERGRLMARTRREEQIALMRQVFLFRHAKSAWDDSEVADFQRPLAPRGAQAARAMAHHMEHAGVRPGLILCSGAVRAQQTLAAVVTVLGRGKVAVEDELYLVGAEGLLDRLRRVDGGIGSVMLIGHNPGMHELAMALADDDDAILGERLHRGLPTGALVTLDWVRREHGNGSWGDLAPGSCRLTGFVRPRDL